MDDQLQWKKQDKQRCRGRRECVKIEKIVSGSQSEHTLTSREEACRLGLCRHRESLMMHGGACEHTALVLYRFLIKSKVEF